MSAKDEYDDEIPEDVLESYYAISLNLLPRKSKDKYIKAYGEFTAWKEEKNITSNDEKVLLVYFNGLVENKNWKSPTLWSHWSMLRTMLNINENIDIKSYLKLKSFMKQQSVGYQPKKGEGFSPEHVQEFCNEAPDLDFLATKVALIFGFLGGLRREELVKVHINHIREEGSTLFVDIPETKHHQPKSFAILDKFVDVVKKYQDLRPVNCATTRFFLNYRSGSCTVQPIGINKFGGMPKQIAQYLKLQNPEKYTGHTFRRTSATLLANAGANMTTMKRHGGWRSNTVAEGYIAHSSNNKKIISEKITSSIVLKDVSSEKDVQKLSIDSTNEQACVSKDSTSSPPAKKC